MLFDPEENIKKN